MYKSILLRTLWERRISTAVWSLSMGVFALLFAWVFEIYKDQVADFAVGLPEQMSAIIGDLAGAATPAGFLAIELYSLFLPLVLAIVGIGFGASAIGREEESGTLELLLASPISRSRIILQKLAAIKVVLLAIPFVTWLGVMLGKAIFPFDVNLSDVALASLSVFLLGMVYAMAALAGQSVSGRRKTGLAIGGGLLTVTYVADIVSKMVEKLENIKYISPFYYFDISNVLSGEGQLGNFLVLIAAASLLYLVAHISFLRRDTGI